MTPRFQRFILDSRTGKSFLLLLTIVYLGYLVAFGRFFSLPPSGFSGAVIEHQVNADLDGVTQYWTKANMRNATTADEQDDNAADFRQQSNDNTAQGARQEGQAPADR